jgi:hypothetical protein
MRGKCAREREALALTDAESFVPSTLGYHADG